MTDESDLSLDALKALFRAGDFERAQKGVQARIDAAPDDADISSGALAEVLALQLHLEHLETLRGINRAVSERDWDRVVEGVDEALGKGLAWDIELQPLTELLEEAKQHRIQEANHQAQMLIEQAEEAEQSQAVNQATALYTQAIALPHLAPSLRAQLQHRLDALKPTGHSTLATLPRMARPDALMEQLVTRILEKSRPQVSEALRLCAVPFWFDLEMLSALRASDDGLDEKVLERIARLSFVHRDDRGRYTLGEDVRHYLLEGWSGDRERFAEAHSRAQSCIFGKLSAACQDEDVLYQFTQPGQAIPPRTLTGIQPEVNDLVQDYLYHTLAVDGETGILLLRHLFHAAEETHRLALAERYLEVADAQRSWLDPNQRAYVDYIRGLLDHARGRLDASRVQFERMLSLEGLPPTLQTYIRRALGSTLVAEQQWVEGIAHFTVALEEFQAAGDTLESAMTMIRLGHAHLDLAVNTWGGGETFKLRQSWSDWLTGLTALISRLPIIVYLMIRLGVRDALPAVWRIGRDMDWTVARLFITAAGWFRRADTGLRQLNAQEGLVEVEENLAWLYLLLGHFSQAEAFYRRLLTHEGVTLGEYRAARARLGLARALMHQDRLTEARGLLEQIRPVFAAYQHSERVAEAQTALAQTYALEEQPAQAVAHYQEAARLYDRLGKDVEATEVVEQMQLLCDEPQTDAETRQSIETTAAQVAHRRYLTRFSLPLLHTFQLLALVGLVGVVLFSLFTSIHVESGTDLGATTALLESRQFSTSAFEPEIEFQLMARLRPSFEVNFTLYLLIGLTALYLVLYAALGLWLTMRTPLRTLQEEQRYDILVDPEGAGRGTEGLPGSLKIKWEQVAALLSSDRGLFHQPIPLFSRFALFGDQGAVIVDGHTRRYLTVRELIQGYLKGLKREHFPRYSFGFSVWYSHSGRLFVGTLVFILAFVITAQISSDVLTTNLGPLPYSLADLYGISYLGLLIPVGWWLAVQPLRERAFLKPETRQVWLIGLVGCLLFAFTFLELAWLKLPVGRPNVAPGLFAAFLVGVAAYHVWTTRRWEHFAFQRGDRVYPTLVRWLSGAVALVIILLSLNLVGREILAYHFLALANGKRQEASDAAQLGDQARAQELSAAALSNYDRALNWIGDDADTYHSRGATLALSGRYDEAIESIQKAIDLNPDKTAYYESLAITYELWAKDLEEREIETALGYFRSARDNYTTVIERVGEGDPGLVTTYLTRAGAYFRIGEYYRKTVKSPEIASENYRAAQADYGQVLQLKPNNTAALGGLGWIEYRLAKLNPDTDARKPGLNAALGYFEQATSIDPNQVAAWAGLGWTHFSVGEAYAWWDKNERRTRSACADSASNPRTDQEKQIYLEENLKAIAAFDHATTLTPEDPNLYSVQGYLYYNLVNCPDVDNDEVYRAAIEAFSRAFELEPDNPEWIRRRGNLYYALGKDYYPQAIADYQILVSLEPKANQYWTLGNLYYAQKELKEAVQAYVRAVELEPTNYRYQTLLGWYAYQSGDYDISVKASEAAASLDPTEPRAFFNWGLALVAMGDAESAWQVYQNGIAVANALANSETALSRYKEALTDLGGVTRDPAGTADALRARLTFGKALIFVRLADKDQAQTTYDEAIAITDRLRDKETRENLYDEAIDGLQALGTEGVDLAIDLISQLETARDK